MMFLFSKVSTIPIFILGSAVVGFRASGGVFGPILAGRIADSSGSYQMAYIISAALLIMAAILTFFTKAPAKRTVEEAVAAKAPGLQAAGRLMASRR